MHTQLLLNQILKTTMKDLFDVSYCIAVWSCAKSPKSPQVMSLQSVLVGAEELLCG